MTNNEHAVAHTSGMNKRLFTLRSLARHLKRFGLSAVWLEDEAKAGRIPCLMAGRRMLFDVEAVEAALLRRAGQKGVATNDE